MWVLVLVIFCECRVSDDVSDDVCDGVSDGVCGVCLMVSGEGSANVELLILCCFGVLLSDRWADRQTDYKWTFVIIELLLRLKNCACIL